MEQKSHCNLVKTKDEWIHLVTLYYVESFQIYHNIWGVARAAVYLPRLHVIVKLWIPLLFRLTGSSFPENRKNRAGKVSSALSSSGNSYLGQMP